MNILLLGSGGREHALALGLARNNTLFIAPGNPGTKHVGTNVSINPNDPDEVTKWATSNGIDLDEVLREVQASNMSKLGADGKPIYREDGKVLKGPGFFNPNIARVLGLESEDGK